MESHGCVSLSFVGFLVVSGGIELDLGLGTVFLLRSMQIGRILGFCTGV